MAYSILPGEVVAEFMNDLLSPLNIVNSFNQPSPFKDIFRELAEKFIPQKTNGKVKVNNKGLNVWLFSDENDSDKIQKFDFTRLANFLRVNGNADFEITSPPIYCFKEIQGQIPINFKLFEGLKRYNEITSVYRSDGIVMKVNYSIVGLLFYNSQDFECILSMKTGDEYKIFPSSKAGHLNALRNLVENFSIRGILYKKSSSKTLFVNLFNKVNEEYPNKAEIVKIQVSVKIQDEEEKKNVETVNIRVPEPDRNVPNDPVGELIPQFEHHVMIEDNNEAVLDHNVYINNAYLVAFSRRNIIYSFYGMENFRPHPAKTYECEVCGKLIPNYIKRCIFSH